MFIGGGRLGNDLSNVFNSLVLLEGLYFFQRVFRKNIGSSEINIDLLFFMERLQNFQRVYIFSRDSLAPLQRS